MSSVEDQSSQILERRTMQKPIKEARFFAGEIDNEAGPLFDNEAIACSSAEGLGVVHFLGLWGRQDERAGRGGSRNIRIRMDALPEQRREGLDALIAQVLVLVPR